jgi:hypothetical protein
MYWSTPPSWSLVNYLSNEPSHAWNGFWTRVLCQFYSGDAICPRRFRDFRLRSAQYFCHISLYGSSKLMILDALERRFGGASEYYFSSIVHLWTHAQILMENSDFSLKSYRWLTILIAIGQELMGTLLHAYKTNLMHILPWGLWSGVETISTNQIHPQDLNLWHSLPSKKKREPNVCTCV